MSDQSPALTYLLIDGENLDATLGMSVLGRRPTPEDRPRWERVLEFVQRVWDRPVRALFFINASSGYLHMPFVQALQAMGMRPIALSGPSDMKVVDVGIQRTLEAITERDGDVMLASHDGDFIGQVKVLLGQNRQVGLLAFREFVNTGYGELLASGLQFFDLEDDARSFNQALPRVRIIDIASFDPVAYL